MLRGHDSLTSFSAGQRRIRVRFFIRWYICSGQHRLLSSAWLRLPCWGGDCQWPLDAPTRRRSALGLVLFALLVAVVMTLGAKKFDRYISPVFMALDIVAVLGLLGLVQAVLGRWQRRRSRTSRGEAALSPSNLGRISVWIVVAALLLFHGLLAFVHYPYYFTYYNPLAGGSRTAPDVLLVGWGEGLDAAAGWLKQQPDAAHQRVISWYSDGPLSYFVQPGQKALSFYFTSYLLDADYAVLYVNQWQRGLPSPEWSTIFWRRNQFTSYGRAGWNWLGSTTYATSHPRTLFTSTRRARRISVIACVWRPIASNSKPSPQAITPRSRSI